ncbi:glycosyltransferase family 2 protein [Qiania dongpingensis]|uniref:Glycosyltransferase family 2 protein n=1 Tax=Qiania dongpingensis TaxID=2763669 RepID=A0A7G9G7U0_9FIRM|nr:glycosyltransferase family 2 protein [Qiania dongpingensis]QNM06872.1 glycosyltransferase family 2 protein [Qiania dongpingensis]
MKKFQYHIDAAECRTEERLLNINVSGWCAIDGRDKFDILVFQDSELLEEQNVTRVERQDICSLLKQDGKFGFSFQGVFNLDSINDRIQILCVGAQTFELFSMTKKELLDKAEKLEISYAVDFMDFDKGKCTLRGWAVTPDHAKLRFKVLDESGDSCRIKFKETARSDVSKLFFGSVDYSYCGFDIRLDDWTDNKLILRISSDTHQVEQEISRKQIIKESKKRKQKYLSVTEICKKTKGADIASDAKIFFTKGPAALGAQWRERYASEGGKYEQWLRNRTPGRSELRQQAMAEFPCMPKISILVPAYHTPISFLKQMVDSVRKQTYQNWELCVADGGVDDDTVEREMLKFKKKDPRIRYKKLEDNLGISGNTNEALAMAAGDFVALLDHDDILEPSVLYEVAKALNEDESIDVVYTDEDKVSTDLKRYFEPNFKPDYNPDFLCSNNYICHFFVARKEIAEEIAGFDSKFDGSQDHDFIFRCIEKARKVYHIPKILYHWRMHMNSMAENPESKMYCYEAGRAAVEAHLERIGIQADVVFCPNVLGRYQVRYRVQGKPMVSVLIPNKDHIEDLSKCIDSILEKTIYDNYEIIIIENNSTEQDTFAYYEEISRNEKINIVYWKKGFNYSALNNYGAAFAKGEFLLLLNNDTEVIDGNWMEQMLGSCQRNGIGAVGAKLCFPDGTIQHCGVIIGEGGVAAHIFSGEPGDFIGEFARAQLQQNLSAVTAACMMIKRSVYEEVGGFNEELAVAFNDVDFCLRIRQRGYWIAYEPQAELYHYESKSRGYDKDDVNRIRFQREVDSMQRVWGKVLSQGDPYFNVNLTLKNGQCKLKTSHN